MARQHTEVAKKFYNSTAWKKCREAYIPTVHGLCEHCLAKGYEEPGHILDHIVEIDINNINDTDITLSWNNLQYLCMSCHNKKTFKKYDEPVREGFGFDSEGNLIELNKKIKF